ncbi:peptidoglycan DD-metalloendopeptidase family protein [Candidatus Uhrbacteria bacterium]|nr:peptidoglycan DD-metalloendopeptidase family protein [Candidatus Uhrbacteria bacterium]MBD3284510.1 peptidoglycan DD-metalloendopeptidase family protein [Candidatus Uhrbacteria bacterium]
MKKLAILITLFAVTGIALSASSALAEDEIRDIVFPTERTVSYTDDFGEPRAGHSHEGIDLMGDHLTPLYAAVDGTVSYIVIPEASWGYAVVLKDSDGWTYHYLHLNNDNPGTDDGMGGPEQAYAPGIKRGATVAKGQLVGWMGDSGNAEHAGNHLHFEIRKPDGTPINPYQSLLLAEGAAGDLNYTVEIAMNTSPSINKDKGLVNEGGTAPCESGTLVKTDSITTVYYCGADGKRYGFPNDRIYFSWYNDFEDVRPITDQELAAIPFGGNVTYRPGSKMVKLSSLPDVYAVDQNGTLRWISSPTVASMLYGDEWAAEVDDLPDAFFNAYKIGDPIDFSD